MKPFNNTIHLFCSVLFFAAKLQGRLINFMNISCFFLSNASIFIYHSKNCFKFLFKSRSYCELNSSRIQISKGPSLFWTAANPRLCFEDFVWALPKQFRLILHQFIGTQIIYMNNWPPPWEVWKNTENLYTIDTLA